MAKRPTIEIDEEYLKEVMAGDVPSLKKRSEVSLNKDPENIETSVEIKQETERKVEKENVKPTGRKKKDPQRYAELFLQKRYPSGRKQTYISSDVYDKICLFLPVISNKLSVTVFLDNILNQHLEQYKDEINELYNQNTKNPLP